MAIEDTTKLISSLTEHGTPADMDYVLRRRYVRIEPQLFTSALAGRKTYFIAEKALTIKSIKMVALSGLAANAASMDYTPGKRTAGGASTAVATKFSGVADTVAALVPYEFTLTAANVQMAEGQLFEVLDAAVGGGRNDGRIMFDIGYEYQ